MKNQSKESKSTRSKKAQKQNSQPNRVVALRSNVKAGGMFSM
ncbi:MAG: hypothetical protein V8K32_13720 [Candidatus Electrothrix gigas]